MRYKSFEITNFKGIQYAKIDIPTDEVTALALIGLNESGKTTILQAIYSFSPDEESKVLFEKGKNPDKPDIEIIPRDKISSFTGSVVVKATLTIDDEDAKEITSHLSSNGIDIDPESIGKSIYVTNINTYKNGEHDSYNVTWYVNAKVKRKNQRKYRKWTPEEWPHIWRAFKNRVPDIAYFPTFVFDLPQKIYLTGHDNDPTNVFYKKIFQDVLDYQGSGLNIDENIVSRVRSSNFLVAWADFLSSFWGSSSQMRMTHVMDLASETITSVIIDSWNRIFGDSINDKKIEIEWKPEAGSTISAGHDIYISSIKSGRELIDLIYLTDRWGLDGFFVFCFSLSSEPFGRVQ
jgi:energy-coupling factor transporter ATP-binding protein EcfA2